MARCSVLIVDDDPTVTAELAKRIASMGHAVSGFAASRDEVLERCAAALPDVVLMDIGIAGPVDGIVVARELLERYSLRVIYLTGDADVGSMERAKATRPYAYLLKPVSSAELRGAIDMAWAARRTMS